MIEHEPEQVPKYREIGGVILGRRGKRPMAYASPEEGVVEVVPQYIYSKPQILALPRRDGVIFSVGPVIGPTTGLITDEWSGSISGDGCQFWVIESFDMTAGYITNRSAAISQQDFAFNDPASLNTFVDGVDGSGSVAWSLGIVSRVEGQYYFGAIYNHDIPSRTIVPNPASYSITPL